MTSAWGMAEKEVEERDKKAEEWARGNKEKVKEAEKSRRCREGQKERRKEEEEQREKPSLRGGTAPRKQTKKTMSEQELLPPEHRARKRCKNRNKAS